MNDFTKSVIPYNMGIVDAMKFLNQDILTWTLTLFVVDEGNRLVGTLTDGDIRRGFIKGLGLDDVVARFMTTDFYKVNNGFSVFDFKKAKEKGVRLLPVVDNEGRITKVYDLKKRESILPLECMIMAGGRGERLRPLTDHIPKPMLPLGNMPIIEHNLNRLMSFGIEKFYISIKYLGEQIVNYFGNGAKKGISIDYIWEDQPLGTAGALSLVKRFETPYILLMNSDLFTDADIEDLYLNTVQNNAEMGVATVHYTTKIPYGIFTTDENHITGLVEKPIYTNYANAGIYILNTSIIDEIPHDQFFNITDLIAKLISSGKTVIHNPIVGYWIDVGQHQDYINAQDIVKHLKND